jgi:hypothetical protein
MNENLIDIKKPQTSFLGPGLWSSLNNQTFIVIFHTVRVGM